MKRASKRGFASAVLAALEDGKYLRVRAGSEPHRFIGIWMVLVEKRLFVRSWSLKPRSWNRVFRTDALGAIQVADRELLVRAKQVRSERLNSAVDRAYAAKYNTPSARQYVRDMSRGASRASTLELVPA